MERKCKICGKTNDLFSLDYQADETDAGVPFTVYVCGSCWEVIAAIAKRVFESLTKKA